MYWIISLNNILTITLPCNISFTWPYHILYNILCYSLYHILSHISYAIATGRQKIRFIRFFHFYKKKVEYWPLDPKSAKKGCFHLWIWTPPPQKNLFFSVFFLRSFNYSIKDRYIQIKLIVKLSLISV